MHRSTKLAALALVALLVSWSSALAVETTSKFQGPKANTGTATFTVEGSKRFLMVSSDFTVPDTPDPHWQLVDSKGAIYQLQRLPIKGDKVNRRIEVPDYVKDVAKVQVWCAYAEVLLGEASFPRPVK